MIGNYTRQANDRIFHVTDEDIYKIWDSLESLSEDEIAAAWKEKIMGLAAEYTLTSRFALMRILCARANDVKLSQANTAFEMEGHKFSAPTIENAENISGDELKQYEDVLMKMASLQNNADPTRDRYLIVRALRDVAEAEEMAVDFLASEKEDYGKWDLYYAKLGAGTLLTRDEALKLGHCLKFSLQEMSWFLLRVFQFEDGFRFNVSGDLIEAYGFLTGKDCDAVQQIKNDYANMSVNIAKNADITRNNNWTQNVTESLPELVCEWKKSPEMMDEKFMTWLLQQSPSLDLPSRTAISVYRQLTAYVYEIQEGIIDTPSIEEFRDEISSICQNESAYSEKVKDYLFDDNNLSIKKSKKIAGDILGANKDLFAAHPDKSKAWRQVAADQYGTARNVMAGNQENKDRFRVQEILSGTVQLEKGDMLQLLWYGFNLCWLKAPVLGGMDVLQAALADFTEAAQEILDAALLPEFYPPHILEQTLMLSIVVCMEDDGLPASSYAAVCESLIEVKAGKKKANK